MKLSKKLQKIRNEYKNELKNLKKCKKKNCSSNNNNPQEKECLQNHCKNELSKLHFIATMMQKEIDNDPEIIKLKEDHQKSIQLQKDCSEKNCSNNTNKFIECRETKCLKEINLTLKKMKIYNKKKNKYSKLFR